MSPRHQGPYAVQPGESTPRVAFLGTGYPFDELRVPSRSRDGGVAAPVQVLCLKATIRLVARSAAKLQIPGTKVNGRQMSPS
jgi:hypothetical protein